MDDEPERWTSIPGYEGRYEVSSLGKLRRLGFYVNRGYGSQAWWPPKELSGTVRKTGAGYVQVSLVDADGVKTLHYMHEVVLLAFTGRCPPEHESCHWDDTPTNNRLSNLRWGTKAENGEDKRRLGRHRQETCGRGHSYTPWNTKPVKGGRDRVCRACAQTTTARWQAAELAKHEEPPVPAYRPRRGAFVKMEGETFQEEADRRYAWLRDRATS